MAPITESDMPFEGRTYRPLLVWECHEQMSPGFAIGVFKLVTVSESEAEEEGYLLGTTGGDPDREGHDRWRLRVVAVEEATEVLSLFQNTAIILGSTAVAATGGAHNVLYAFGETSIVLRSRGTPPGWRSLQDLFDALDDVDSRYPAGEVTLR